MKPQSSESLLIRLSFWNDCSFCQEKVKPLRLLRTPQLAQLYLKSKPPQALSLAWPGPTAQATKDKILFHLLQTWQRQERKSVSVICSLHINVCLLQLYNISYRLIIGLFETLSKYVCMGTNIHTYLPSKAISALAISSWAKYQVNTN